MRWLIPWKLLEWARDNRVLRVRWFWVEAEFAQPMGVMPAPQAEKPWTPPMDLPEEERARQVKEHERLEQEKLLYHSA